MGVMGRTVGDTGEVVRSKLGVDVFWFGDGRGAVYAVIAENAENDCGRVGGGEAPGDEQ